VHWRAGDALSVITKAEYSVDGGEWTVVDPVTKLSDSKELDYNLSLPDASAGEHTIAVRVADEFDNQSAEKLWCGKKPAARVSFHHPRKKAAYAPKIAPHDFGYANVSIENRELEQVNEPCKTGCLTIRSSGGAHVRIPVA